MRDESVSPNPMEAEMDVEDVIKQMKQCFLADRTEESAVETLEKLLTLQSDKIEMDIWIKVKDLLACLIDTITVPNLVSRHQIIVLNAINNCASVVVDFLATLIEQSIGVLEAELATSHIAVPIAFARRITDGVCCDSIAKLLWRFAHIDAVQNELRSLLTDADSETRFRIHQVTANYLKIKGDGSAVLRLLNSLIEEINVTDILTQITAIEMLSEVAYQNKAATAYLFSLGLIERMYQLLNTVTEHPDGGFLFPGIMKFFGHLCITDAQCLVRFPNFLQKLFDMVFQFDRLDASSRTLAFDTFAVVASTDESRRYLSSLTEYDLDKALNMFGVAIATGPAELRLRHLEALCLLFYCENKTPKSDVSEILKKWWHSLGSGFPPVIVLYLSTPFAEQRIATLQLVETLSNYDWAVECLKNTSGFLNALMDRSRESTSEGKNLRFKIVCGYIDKFGHLFQPETLMRLKLYRRQGPCFVERLVQLDMANT